MLGMERPIPEQSTAYLARLRAEAGQFDRGETWESPATPILSSSDGIDALPDDDRPVVVPSRPALGGVSTPEPVTLPAPRFTPTPTGRRAKGQLEYDVLTVCDEYSRDVYEWEYCTPKLVAERIAVMNQEPELPSTGAINAVWDRWEKLGFAKQDKKPSRFVSFVVDGQPATLEMLKARTKSERRRAAGEAKRGVLRPRR
jgi:hypothetical protein